MIYEQLSRTRYFAIATHLSYNLSDCYMFLKFQSSEESLPICSPNSVCNKVDTYGSPWVEKQCRCPTTPGSKSSSCSTSIHPKDGHTVVDRNRQYKVKIEQTFRVSIYYKAGIRINVIYRISYAFYLSLI